MHVLKHSGVKRRGGSELDCKIPGLPMAGDRYTFRVHVIYDNVNKRCRCVRVETEI